MLSLYICVLRGEWVQGKGNVREQERIEKQEMRDKENEREEWSTLMSPNHIRSLAVTEAQMSDFLQKRSLLYVQSWGCFPRLALNYSIIILMYYLHPVGDIYWNVLHHWLLFSISPIVSHSALGVVMNSGLLSGMTEAVFGSKMRWRRMSPRYYSVCFEIRVTRTLSTLGLLLFF